MKPQISHSPNVYEGTYSSPRIVGTSVLPWVAGNAVRGVQNTDVISGPGLASSGTVAIATNGTTSNSGLLPGARGAMWPRTSAQPFKSIPTSSRVSRIAVLSKVPSSS